jgi:hypothetical protein
VQFVKKVVKFKNFRRVEANFETFGGNLWKFVRKPKFLYNFDKFSKLEKNHVEFVKKVMKFGSFWKFVLKFGLKFVKFVYKVKFG